MPCVTILYPHREGARFDFDHYLNTHIPMSMGLFGDDFQIKKGLASVDGSPAPYVCQLTIGVESIDGFIATITERGHELLADMPNYTDIEPIIQFDEILPTPKSSRDRTL